MSRVEREAFVESPHLPTRVLRLNQAVRNHERLLVLAPSGTGKDRFFDWWWQQGCTRADIVGGKLINSDDVVLVSLVPPPSRRVVPTCVAFMKIWRALRELDFARSTGRRVRPSGKPRSWYSDDHALSLVYDFVHELDDELQPQAYVLLNGEYLDPRALQYLLELCCPLHRGQANVARRGLVICASVEPAVASDHKFGKMVNEIKELRAVWPNRLEIKQMDGDEFSPVMLTFIRRNLNTVFGKDVDDAEQKSILQEAADWTQGMWRLIATQLVPLIDEELGPQKGDEPRILTKKVWERVRKRWQQRLW
jgi:hypothetical protein